jgi:hypothetical protein
MLGVGMGPEGIGSVAPRELPNTNLEFEVLDC